MSKRYTVEHRRSPEEPWTRVGGDSYDQRTAEVVRDGLLEAVAAMPGSRGEARVVESDRPGPAPLVERIKMLRSLQSDLLGFVVDGWDRAQIFEHLREAREVAERDGLRIPDSGLESFVEGALQLRELLEGRRR